MKTQNLQDQAKALQQQLDKVNAQIKKEQEENEFAYKKLDSFEKCCVITGNNPKDKKFSQGNPDTNAYEMLKVITKAINGNKKVTGAEYFPYFNKTKKPGSGFFGSVGDGWFAGCSDVSSRLALLDSARAIHSGKIFEKIHYDYMVES